MKIKAGVLWEAGKPRPYAESLPLCIEEIELDGPGPGEVLVQIALDDRLGQRTRIVLTDVERPASIPDAEFSFVPPEGVDVIGEAAL